MKEGSTAKNELVPYGFWQSRSLPLPKTTIVYRCFVHAKLFHYQNPIPSILFDHRTT